MNKKIIPAIIIATLVILGVVTFLTLSTKSTSKISPTNIITLSDENSTVVITRNNIDKTATIDMETYLDNSEMDNNEFGIDMAKTIINFGTKFTCNLLSLAFFNETALNELVEEWSSMGEATRDSEDNMPDKSEENLLKGYEITQINYSLKDKNKKEVLSECLITGPGAENIVLKIDGKITDLTEETSFYDY